MPIRPATAADVPAMKKVIAATELFPEDMLDDMMAPFLSGNSLGELWFVATASNAVGLGYCAQERMTEGTWNMLLIAVDPVEQNKGFGQELMAYAEQTTRQRGARILLVETSGLSEFEPTRNFYRNQNYEEEARLRDYYKHGEYKIIFRKSLLKKCCNNGVRPQT
jgi:ribosomal protein S18 acetylase RimI-like enzyme